MDDVYNSIHILYLHSYYTYINMYEFFVVKTNYLFIYECLKTKTSRHHTRALKHIRSYVYMVLF